MELQELLKRGKALDFHCTEEDRLLTVLEVLQGVSQSLKKILSSLSSSPLLTGFPLTRSVAHTEVYSLDNIEQLMLQSLALSWQRLPLEDTIVAISDPKEFLLGESADEVEEELETELDKNDPNDFDKPSLGSIETLLHQCDNFHLRVTEMELVRQAVSCGRAIDSQAQYIIQRLAMHLVHPKIDKDKDKEKERAKRKMRWVRVLRVMRCLHRFPFSLPSSAALCEAVKHVQLWRSEVRGIQGLSEKDKHGKDKETNRRKKENSNSRGGSNTAMPLRRIDALLSEGERLPLNFPLELTILREQREQAKNLLQKLRESLDLTRRKQKRSMDDDVQREKLDYASFRALLEEGEALYGDDEREGESVPRNAQRDLDRAQGVMEVAEEWLENVRRIVSAHLEVEGRLLSSEINNIDAHEVIETQSVESELGSYREDLANKLRDQLETVAALPFSMDEAEAVKALLLALEWTMIHRQSLMGLGRVKPRFADLIKMRDEIVK
jgi:hypothetical protein